MQLEVFLGNSVEADSGAESMSENLCAEFGRNVVLDLSKRVAAASDRKNSRDISVRILVGVGTSI